MSARIQVSDLLAHPGTARSVDGAVPMSVQLPHASIDGEATFDAEIRSLTDGVVARGTAGATVALTCTRCLKDWVAVAAAAIDAVFRLHPDLDGDELPVEPGGWIDLGPVVHDETVLGIPARPLCRQECLGLCPTCGTDLNVEPCEGHGDIVESPFAALAQLFADETPHVPES
jgi:uncharacterized protein